MIAAAPEPKANMGSPEPRYDGRLKVTGAARYSSDMPLNNPAFAFLVTSSIAKIDTPVASFILMTVSPRALIQMDVDYTVGSGSSSSYGLAGQFVRSRNVGGS